MGKSGLIPFCAAGVLDSKETPPSTLMLPIREHTSSNFQPRKSSCIIQMRFAQSRSMHTMHRRPSLPSRPEGTATGPLPGPPSKATRPHHLSGPAFSFAAAQSIRNDVRMKGETVDRKDLTAKDFGHKSGPTQMALYFSISPRQIKEIAFRCHV